jgi:hypothetical protein
MLRKLRNTALVPFQAVDQVELNTKNGANLQRYLKWRQHALELASIFALLAMLIASVQVSATLGDLKTSKEYCDAAYQPVPPTVSGSGAAPAASSRRRLDAAAELAGRVRSNFPSDPALSSNSSIACAVLKDAASQVYAMMKPERQPPNSIVLTKDETRNVLCGTFGSTGCSKEVSEMSGCGDGLDKCSRKEEDKKCKESNLGDVSCGKVDDPTQCARLADTAARLFNPTCIKLVCRRSGTRCPTKSPCSGAYYCGMDESGVVCGQSEQECEQTTATRWRRSELNMASDGTFALRSATFLDEASCKQNFEYGDDTIPTEWYAVKLLSTSTMSGMQVLGSQIPDPVANITSDGSLLSAREKQLLKDTALFETQLTIEAKRVRRFTWYNQVSVYLGYCGCYGTQVPRLGDSLLEQGAGLKCLVQTPECALAASFNASLSLPARFHGYNPREKVFVARDMGVNRKVELFNQAASCCAGAVKIDVSGAANAPMALAGNYLPMKRTVNGRPAYEGKNLGPDGKGLFLFYVSAQGTWVVGRAVPAASSRETEVTGALLSLSSSAFTADALTGARRWRKEKLALIATGSFCDDNDEELAALVKGFPPFPAQELVTSCTDLAFLNATSLCLTNPDINAVCGKTCRRCPDNPSVCADTRPAIIAVITQGTHASCSEISLLCHTTPQENVDAPFWQMACPRTCGKEPCQNIATCENGDKFAEGLLGLPCASLANRPGFCASKDGYICPAACGRCMPEFPANRVADGQPPACNICKLANSAGLFSSMTVFAMEAKETTCMEYAKQFQSEYLQDCETYKSPQDSQKEAAKQTSLLVLRTKCCDVGNRISYFEDDQCDNQSGAEGSSWLTVNPVTIAHGQCEPQAFPGGEAVQALSCDLAAKKATLKVFNSKTCGSTHMCQKCHTFDKPLGVHCYASKAAFDEDPKAPLEGKTGLPPDTKCTGAEYTFAYSCTAAFDSAFVKEGASSGSCVYYADKCCGGKKPAGYFELKEYAPQQCVPAPTPGKFMRMDCGQMGNCACKGESGSLAANAQFTASWGSLTCAEIGYWLAFNQTVCHLQELKQPLSVDAQVTLPEFKRQCCTVQRRRLFGTGSPTAQSIPSALPRIGLQRSTRRSLQSVSAPANTTVTISIRSTDGEIFCTNAAEASSRGALRLTNDNSEPNLVRVMVAVKRLGTDIGAGTAASAPAASGVSAAASAAVGGSAPSLGAIGSGTDVKLSGPRAFRARLCSSNASSCIETDPLLCFNDVVNLPPGSTLDFPLVADPGFETSYELDYQFTRDETVRFVASSSAPPKGDGVGFVAQQASILPARRRLGSTPNNGGCTAGQDVGSSQESLLSTPVSGVWSACDSATHLQTKDMTCVAGNGQLVLPNSICQANPGGGTIVAPHRTCCTEAEMVKAELMRKQRSQSAGTALQVVLVFTPMWWAATTFVAHRKRTDWESSAKWNAVAWSVPFTVIFCQYLLPWVNIYGLDSGGLVSAVLSSRSDTPSRDPVGACPTSADMESGVLGGLVGQSSSLGLLQSAKKSQATASNAPTDVLTDAYEAKTNALLAQQYTIVAQSSIAFFEMVQRVGFSIKSTVSLLPLALSLLPGIAQGAIFCKLIMPSAALPGWTFVVVPVLLAPMLAVMLLSIVQLLSNWLFSAGTLFYMLAVLWPLYRSLSLTTAFATSTELRAAAFKFSRAFVVVQVLLKLASCACFVGYVFVLLSGNLPFPQLKTLLANALEGSALAVVKLILSSFANYFITTVLVADMLLKVTVGIRLSEGQTESLRGADQVAMEAALAAHPGFRKAATITNPTNLMKDGEGVTEQANPHLTHLNPLHSEDGHGEGVPKRKSIL